MHGTEQFMDNQIWNTFVDVDDWDKMTMHTNNEVRKVF